MADTSSSSGQGDFAQPLSDRVQQPTVNVSGFTPSAGSVSNAQVATDAAIAQSKLDLAITDAQVATGAAIAQSKLALAVTNAEVASGAAIAQSKLALAITNAEVSASAAVAQTKVASSLSKSSLSADIAYLHGDSGAIVLVNTLSYGASAQMHGQRHPYSGDRHIESGTATAAGTSTLGSVAVTFTDAYASTPNVVATAQVDGFIVWCSSVSTTGFTINVRDVVGVATVDVPLSWFADGAD